MKGLIVSLLCMGFVSVGFAAVDRDRDNAPAPDKILTCDYDRHGNEVNCREMGKAEEGKKERMDKNPK